MRKIILVLIFALLATGCFAPGALAQKSSKSPIILRVGGAGAFRLPDKNSTNPIARANRAIVDAFESEHPDIQLEAAQGLQIQGPAAESSLLLAFAGGTAPDVIYVNFRNSASYIGQGFLMPLDSYINRDPNVFKRLKPEIRKVLLDSGNGHIYSLPYSQYVQALYYRRDLFAKAGLDPDKPPRNWQEFYDDAQKLTDQPKGQWGFEFDTSPDGTAYFWINFLWQAGGDVIRKNAKGQWEAAFDSPQGVTALNFYKKLMTGAWRGPDGKIYHGVAQHSSTEATDRAQGKVAMWFQYQSNVVANLTDATTLNPSLVGIAPMPKGPTGITANELNAAMWGISSQIKDPKVRDAAWEFVKFMASDEADRIRTKSFVEAGLGNTINPESLQKYGYGDYTTRASRRWLETNRTLFEHGHPEPYAENMSQIYVLLGSPLAAIELNPNADPQALLAKAAREVDTKLTGYVPPGQLRHRREAATAIFIGIVIGLLVWLGIALRKMVLDRARKNAEKLAGAQTPNISAKVFILSWLFMLPAVLSILFWAYYPLARGLVMAFQNYHILGTSSFAGLDNFIDVFYQPSFWYGVRNSIEYTVYNLILGFFLPVFIALGLSEIPVGKMLFRTIYYLPAVLAGMVVVMMWRWFEDSTAHGWLNIILAGISGGHIGPIKWLDDPHWAMIGVVLPAVWAAAGPGSIIYLAALKSIPEDLYEAADLDGAGVWTKIWRVTLPTLKPLILIQLVGATIGAFQAAQNILVMTGGGPLYATHTLGLEIFYNAFMYLKFGYATAAAWIMGSMLVGFTLFQLRMMKDLKFSAVG